MKILLLSICALCIIACEESQEKKIEKQAEACIMMAIEHGRDWRNTNYPECSRTIRQDYMNTKKSHFADMCRNLADSVIAPFACKRIDKGVVTCLTTDQYFKSEMFYEKSSWQSCQNEVSS